MTSVHLAYLFYFNDFHPSTLRPRHLPVTPAPKFFAEQFVPGAASLIAALPTAVLAGWVTVHYVYVSVTNAYVVFSTSVLPLVMLACSIAVSTASNPMHALLNLLCVFFIIVLLYFHAGAQFVGNVFLIVYVGAVSILFIFIGMLFSVKALTEYTSVLFHRVQCAGATAIGALVAIVYEQIIPAVNRALTAVYAALSSIQASAIEAILSFVRYGSDIKLMAALYSVHSLLFLIVTVILLVALLGAIILATATTERATKTTDIRDYTPQPIVVTLPPVIAVTAICTLVCTSFDVQQAFEVVALMSAYN